MKSKKILSLLLALMMMLSVVPFYASAEAVALTEANVVEWPTIEGEIYFGQKLSDGLTVVGGEVQYNGTTVPGKFEFINPEYVPTSTTEIAGFRFIPDNTDEYIGFEVQYVWDITYTVNTVTPILVDENDLPVATPIAAAGKNIRTSTLSGGEVKNPITGEVITSASWSWVNKRTNVSESGYFQAQCIAGIGYDIIYADVYIYVSGENTAAAIIEYPTIDAVDYKEGLTASELTITGGETAIPGTFAITDTKTLSLGDNSVYVTFTPDDTSMEAYQFSVTVTVNKGNYKFVDENGDVCVPELTVPYGQTLEDASNKLRAFIADVSKLTGADVARISFPDNDAKATLPVGTNTYNVRITPSHEGNSNYNITDLQFVLTVEPTDVKVNIFALTDTIQVRKANYNDPTPTGTFAIYVDGVLLKDGVKENTPVEWNPTVSKTYEIKAVYTPAENDPVNVEDVTISAERKLERKITYGDLILNGNPSYRCGDTVSLKANASAENFEGWVITDAAGNEVNLGVDLTALNITFTMSDYDLNIEAKVKSTSSGGLDIDNIFGGLDMDELMQGDSECWFINLLRNIIAKIGAFIEELKGTFRSIGDIS